MRRRWSKGVSSCPRNQSEPTGSPSHKPEKPQEKDLTCRPPGLGPGWAAAFGLEDYYWYSWPQPAESMERLADYRFEWVLPGHGQKVHLPAADMRQQIRRLARSMRERSRV